MKNIRLIPRLDIKGNKLIKGINLEGLRVVGSPNDFAKKYYLEGADELLYMDAVASLYGRNNLTDLIKEASKEVFIPITVGGGIRSVEDARLIFKNGADKIALNSAAIQNPSLISELANIFGSSSIVVSIEAKEKSISSWEAFTECGRTHSGLDVLKWCKTVEKLGAGEILITSIDKEGTRKGFDLGLVEAVTNSVKIPIISSGGMGKLDDFKNIIHNSKADAVSMAYILHYNKISLKEIRKTALENNINIRKLT